MPPSLLTISDFDARCCALLRLSTCGFAPVSLGHALLEPFYQGVSKQCFGRYISSTHVLCVFVFVLGFFLGWGVKKKVAPVAPDWYYLWKAVWPRMSQTWSGHEGERSLCLALYLSFSRSLCLCLLPTSAVSQSPSYWPTSQAGCTAAFPTHTHTHTNSHGATTGKGLLCFPLQVLSPTSLGVDLVIIINNRSSSRDKPWAFQNSRFCLWDGVARTDKLGVYLRGFYFGQCAM